MFEQHMALLVTFLAFNLMFAAHCRAQTTTTPQTAPARVSIEGRLVNEQGQPVTSVSIYTRRTQGGARGFYGGRMAGSGGAFIIPNLPAGEAELSVYANGYVPLIRKMTAPASSVTLTLLTQGAVIEGRVVARGTGEPVEGAVIKIMGITEPPSYLGARMPTVNTILWHKPPPSLKDGTFAVEHLLPGKYQLSARTDHLRPYTPRAGAIVTSESLERDFITLGEKETTSGIELVVFPGYTLSGVITERGTTHPLEGVTVSMSSGIAGNEMTTVTDSAGNYRLDGVPCLGGAVLSYWKKGYVADVADTFLFPPGSAPDPGADSIIKQVGLLPISAGTSKASTDPQERIIQHQQRINEITQEQKENKRKEQQRARDVIRENKNARPGSEPAGK